MSERCILVMDIHIRLPQSDSIKSKRQIKRRLMDRLKKKHNLSLVETQMHDEIKQLFLTCAYVALSESLALQKRETLIEDFYQLLEPFESELNIDDYII